LYAFSPGDIGVIYPPVSTIIEVLPCAIFISIVFLSRGIHLNKFYDIILVIGVFQVCCVILTFLFPGLREYIVTSSSSESLEDTFAIVRDYRIYGLARGYTFTMPLFQGLCIIIATVLGIYKTPKYYFLIPLYVLSIVVNARVALISIVIVPCVILLVSFNKNIVKKIVLNIFLLLSIYYAAQIISYLANNSPSYSTWNWLNSAIEEVYSFKSGQAEGNLYALTDTMWFYPEGIDLLVGTGENVFGREFKSSDIGYVVNLYYGGIVLSILIYVAYFVLLMKYSKDNLIEKTINLSVIVYLFSANFKGNVFRPNEIINGVLALIIFSIALRILHKSENKVSSRGNVFRVFIK
jgi:hypothetical protein